MNLIYLINSKLSKQIKQLTLLGSIILIKLNRLNYPFIYYVDHSDFIKENFFVYLGSIINNLKLRIY